MIDYNKLQNATYDDYTKDADVRNVLNTAYFGAGQTGSIGQGEFNDRKSFALNSLSKIGSDVAANVEKYTNWNGSTDPRDQAAINEQWQAANNSLSELKTRWGGYGLDLSSHPTIQGYYSKLGDKVGGGMTATQRAAQDAEMSKYEQGFNNAKAAGTTTPTQADGPGPGGQGLFFTVDGKQYYSPSGKKYDAVPAEQAPQAPANASAGATGAQGYTRDAQGNVYDAQGNHVSYESLPKGPNGAPLMNLETLPLKDAKTGSSTTGGDLSSSDANDIIKKYTPSQYSGAQTDAMMSADKAHQQYVKDFINSQTSQTQNETLTQEYTRLTKEAGLEALNTQLLNMKNIMEGTEDDIRNEVAKAGGFATNSQVLALTNARNKTMIQNYNNLLQTRENMQNNIQMMIGLSEKDRAYAMDQVDRQLNFDEKQMQYADKMLANAQDSLANSAKAMGWSGILEAALATGDPDAIKRINATMGPGFDLNTAAQQELQSADEKKYQSGIVGEYQFYADQEKAAGRAPVDFNTYQNMDANRKARVASAGAGGGGGGGGLGTPGALDNYISEVTHKPLNDTERAALGFAQRMQGSGAIIDQIGSNFTGKTSVGGFLPSALQSSERQQYEQAKRDFVNAKLRKESGAAISPSEFSSAEKQYFPQAGDSAAVVEQKTRNRQAVIANLYLEGGKPSYANKSTTAQGGSQDQIINDIKMAIKDTSNFKTREQLISAIVGEYGISQDQASQLVYSNWTDNMKR